MLSVREAAARLAREDNLLLNYWIATAVAEKVGAAQTAAELLKVRRGGASPDWRI